MEQGAARAQRGLSLFVLVLAGAGWALAAAILICWAVGLSSVPTLASGDDPMVPWTAIGCLLAASWVLARLAMAPSPASRLVGWALAAGVLAIGLVATLENLLPLDTGADTLLWPSRLAETVAAHPGRPSLQTAIALSVLGLAQIVATAGRGRGVEAAGFAACGAASLGLLGLLGRAVQIAPTFTSEQLGSGGLSTPTALTLTLVGGATASAMLGPELVRLASQSRGARRQLQVLLPAAIAIPMAVFLGAYATLELSGTAQIIGPLVAALAVICLLWALRLVNLGVSADVAAHSETERRLNERIALYAAAVESSQDAVLTKDLAGTITSWNPAAERLYGYSSEQAIGRNVELIVPEDRREELRSILDRLAAGRPVDHIETVRETRAGERLDVSLTVSPVLDGSGAVCGASSIARDVTERRRADAVIAERTEELRQAQKMEAIGRLAGGVAHDFNNLLTVIVGAAQLLRLDPADSVDDDELLNEIADSAEQAAALTAQLLAFGRQSPAKPELLDPNQRLRQIESMLGRLIGSDIDLSLTLDPQVGAIEADPTQFQQVIMNLAVNARDAMPTGGRLAISTARGDDFVRIEVSDTGVGIDAEQLPRIFEPFYTTKEVGSGTGLGLSTSHGIVAQLGGRLSVRSEPGEGATFTIELPRAEGRLEAAGAPAEAGSEPGGGETILLVDDQAALRRVTARALRGAGYTVLDTGGGAEALAAAGAHEGGIDLLLSDLVMPAMNGYELAEALLKARPEVKVLFMSGHPLSTRERYGEAARQPHLQKPFAPDDLRRAVRAALG